MKHRKLWKNRGGFSLVELLVAVVVLSIASLPVLRAFFVSAATVSKSRNLGEVTLAAQNVAETVEAVSLSDLKELGTVSVHGDPPSEYDLEIAGIDGGKYSADVTLTGADEVTDNVHTPMDAVFTQKGGGLNPDTAAMAQFKLDASAVTADEDAAYDVERTITIHIDEKSENAYEYSCTYHYDGKVSYEDEDGHTQREDLTPVDYSYVFYNGTVSPGASSRLASLYFFFDKDPQISGRSVYDDTVTVQRTTEEGGCTPVSVFLVKQKKVHDHSSYHLLVQLKGDRPDSTKVYSNVTDSTYRIFRRGGVWYEKRVNSFGKLVATDPEYRIYHMIVRIRGKDDNVIYTLETSKLG
ncbi:MAG: prepilin-type N-terminal cleavage/methylation domain-containing protein [Oscillospiraceae bacterium]|nr:prepilin-type N-terminal cleavage/methylation domain-containing protein [Oscillospiraceae bacterium]